MNDKYPKYLLELRDYLLGIGNYSKSYVRQIIIAASQFLNFINVYKYNNKYNSLDEISLNEIRSLTNSDIYSFIYSLAEQGIKDTTRILKIELLKKFFDYLFRIKHTLFKEPLKEIKIERKNQRLLPNYLSLNEAQKLINVYKNSNNELDIRDTAILKLFLTSGLRLSEIVNIKVKDVNFNENKFNVIGKGNKERVCYMNDMSKDAILKYIELRKEKNVIDDNEYLFLTNKNSQISVNAMKKIVKKAYRLAGLNTKLYAVHTLRHTCATLLIRNNIDIKIIQEVLGHSRIETTQIYTHIYNKKVEEEMLKHPLSKFKISEALAFSN